MSKDEYRRFGKYLILDHLVDGGMAKICRASYLGEQANKIVAIKMVQPQYSKNQAFVQMFEDELKVTFGLLHPNIAQMYDYGLVDEQLYCAMEYVDGANLKQYLDRLKQMKFVFPVEITTYIISQVCQALHYAHTFTDKLTGKHFNIIHRDISPHNIMLTYDGAVKVIDFGIAKADSNSEATQAGTIKGKLSYIAPEYLEGMELDHRYDQFAVGITLWEMLCSRKLFSAKNDLAVLKLIQACKVPKPSSINPNVPAELDEIVMKSLSKDRGQRYENMDKMNRALVKFLYSKYPDFNATDLSYFSNQLFKKEIERDKKKFVEFGKVDITPFLNELKQEESPAAKESTKKATSYEKFNQKATDQKTGKIEIDLGTFDGKTEAHLDLDFSENTLINHKIKPGAGKVLPKAPVDKNVGEKKSTNSAKTTRTRVKSATVVSSQNEISSKESKGFGFGAIASAVAACVLLITIFNPKFVGSIIGVDLKKVFSTRGNKKITHTNNIKHGNNRGIGSEEKGIISLYGFDPGMKLYLNGKLTEVEAYEVQVELNKSYELSVIKPGFKKWVMEDSITLSDEHSLVRVTIPDLEKEKIGYISTSENYSPGSKISFRVNGDVIEKSLPLKNERVPAGTYNAIITNSLLGTEVKIQFEVKENKRNFIR